MTTPFATPRLRPVVARAALAPAESALISLALLHQAPAQASGAVGFHADQPDQVDSWVVSTARSLSATQRATNRLIFHVLGAALVPQQEYEGFAAYLDDLDATPAIALRDRVLQPLLRSGEQPEALLDPQTFATRHAQIYHHEEPDHALIAEASALLRDPGTLKALLSEHLRTLWASALAEEWRRKQPLLRAIAQGLQQRQFPSASAPATIRAVIGRDLPAELIAQLHDIEELIIVPSPHVGLYATRFGSRTSMWVFVAVTTLSGWALRQAAIRPSEVLARIAPLADETGLKILDLLAHRGEITAQELIQQLGLSQSSISRHLKALGGYLIERRGEGANKRYRLSRSHLDWTIATLQSFLATDQTLLEEADLTLKGRGFAPAPGQPIGPVRSAAPVVEIDSDLRRFMDQGGRLTAFPTRRKDQLLVLAFLAEKFELQRSYTEREVNAIIQSTLSPTFSDIATLRRELCDFNYLARERDGSRYWRLYQSAPPAPQPDGAA